VERGDVVPVLPHPQRPNPNDLTLRADEKLRTARRNGRRSKAGPPPRWPVSSWTQPSRTAPWLPPLKTVEATPW